MWVSLFLDCIWMATRENNQYLITHFLSLLCLDFIRTSFNSGSWTVLISDDEPLAPILCGGCKYYYV